MCEYLKYKCVSKCSQVAGMLNLMEQNYFFYKNNNKNKHLDELHDLKEDYFDFIFMKVSSRVLQDGRSLETHHVKSKMYLKCRLEAENKHIPYIMSLVERCYLKEKYRSILLVKLLPFKSNQLLLQVLV